MYINTFKYQPSDVSCVLCTEYSAKQGCTASHCPWLAERIEAGVVGYGEAVMETMPHNRWLRQRLCLLVKNFPGTLWSNIQHEKRMEAAKAIQGYCRRRDTPQYYAVMYLLTANQDIFQRTANCFCKHGLEFDYAVLREISLHNYALFMAARSIYTKSADICFPPARWRTSLRTPISCICSTRLAGTVRFWPSSSISLPISCPM